MSSAAEPGNSRRSLFGMSLWFRIMISAGIMSGLVLPDIWFFREAPYFTITINLVVFFFSLSLIARPKWFDRWVASRQKRIDDWNPRPGQWS
jgi:hypothetical protein